MKLLCRDPVEEDYQNQAVIRRSCGAAKPISSGAVDIFGRFDSYMKACGYESSMDRSLVGIESILERRLREKKHEE